MDYQIMPLLFVQLNNKNDVVYYAQVKNLITEHRTIFQHVDEKLNSISFD